MAFLDGEFWPLRKFILTKEVGASMLRIDGEKQVKPKGLKEPIMVYDIGGIGDKYNLFLSKEEEIFLPISETISVVYLLVDGKQLGDNFFKGNLVKNSPKGAEIRAEKRGEDLIPSPMGNIKLNFLNFDAKGLPEISEDIYAKVLDKTTSEQSFYIHFTFKPPAVAAKLLQLLTEAVNG